jgi:hypothetical protein
VPPEALLFNAADAASVRDAALEEWRLALSR